MKVDRQESNFSPAFEIFASREQQAVEVLADYALAHRSEKPRPSSSEEHANLAQATIWCQNRSLEFVSTHCACFRYKCIGEFRGTG
jgi:hypothetical protein